MNLPNRLTIFRILIVPIMIIVYYIPWLGRNYVFSYTVDGAVHGLNWMCFIELLIFAIASITDFLDGKIARKFNLVTNFGKFLDPLADKILVFAAMTIIMVAHDKGFLPDGKLPNGLLLPVWVFIVILIREFAVSGIRMVAATNGETIAAGKSGKAKTFVTMIALIVLFLCGLHDSLIYIGQVLIYIACLLTVISGVQYFVYGKKYLFEAKEKEEAKEENE